MEAMSLQVLGLSTWPVKLLEARSLQTVVLSMWAAKLLVEANELNGEGWLWQMRVEMELNAPSGDLEWQWNWRCKGPLTVDHETIVWDSAWPALRLLMRDTTPLSRAVRPLRAATPLGAATLLKGARLLTMAAALLWKCRMFHSWNFLFVVIPHAFRILQPFLIFLGHEEVMRHNQVFTTCHHFLVITSKVAYASKFNWLSSSHSCHAHMHYWLLTLRIEGIQLRISLMYAQILFPFYFIHLFFYLQQFPMRPTLCLRTGW